MPFDMRSIPFEPRDEIESNSDPDTERFVVDAFVKRDAVVEVAMKFDAVTIPSTRALPATESFSVGVVVPIPTFPVK